MKHEKHITPGSLMVWTGDIRLSEYSYELVIERDEFGCITILCVSPTGIIKLYHGDSTDYDDYTSKTSYFEHIQCTQDDPHDHTSNTC